MIAGIVAVFLFLGKRSEATTARVESEFLTPWVAAVRQGSLEEAWASLTTESYREAFPREAVAATYREVRARWGTPVEVVVTRSNATFEMTTGRAFLSTVTRWRWSGGTELYLTFELVDVPGAGYRLDRGKVGGRNRQIAPEGTPDGPW